jgi:hypothetical protein
MHDIIFEKFAGHSLGKSCDLRVQLIERSSLARGIGHATAYRNDLHLALSLSSPCTTMLWSFGLARWTSRHGKTGLGAYAHDEVAAHPPRARGRAT